MNQNVSESKKKNGKRTFRSKKNADMKQKYSTLINHCKEETEKL